MPGKNTYLTPLQVRKQLLVAESELNRTQMMEEIAALSTGFHALTQRAQALGSIASSAAALIAGISAFRREKCANAKADAKPSWLQTAIKGAGLVSTLWAKFRSRDQDQSQE